MKKALVIGIDDYSHPHELSGCVNDAINLCAMLESNGDGSPNFDVKCLTSNLENLNSELLHDAITDLFSGDADIALLYFAGHGVVSDETNAGFLISVDGKHPNWGVPLTSILELANSAHPRIKSSVIILDSCQSGFAGEVSGLGLGKSGPSIIGDGVTILTACHRRESATETNGHGTFTSILLDGITGAASDIIGRITPASLYAHVDQTLGEWEQRPIYKANVKRFITLRNVAPKVPLDVLRRLPNYFPSPSFEFQLDPSFEPDRGQESENLKDILVNDDNVKVYRELQNCHRLGLIAPTKYEHMWHTAVYSGTCKLTASGAHYRYLATLKRI